MATATQATDRSLRMSVDEFKKHFDATEPLLVLDVRQPKAWDASNVKIQGAIRVPPDRFRLDPSWPKDRLTVAYCT